MAKTKDIKPRFQTYYDRYHVDKGTEFDPNSSLTDQDYKMMTDVNYLIEHMAGHNRTPIYGIQDNSTFEDWSNEMALVKRKFNNLDEDTRKAFGDAQTFLKWCADPNNYIEDLPITKKAREELRLKEEKEKNMLEKQQKQAELIAKAIKDSK